MSVVPSHRHLIQCVRLLRMCEGVKLPKLFRVATVVSIVQDVHKELMENPSRGVGQLLLARQLGQEKTSHVLAHLMLTLCWTMRETRNELIVSNQIARNLAALQNADKHDSGGESLLRSARSILWNGLSEHRRSALYEICDVLYDIAAFQASIDAAAPERIAKLFAPALLRGVDSREAAPKLLSTMVQFRRELFEKERSDDSTESEIPVSAAVPVVVAAKRPISFVADTSSSSERVNGDDENDKKRVPQGARDDDAPSSKKSSDLPSCKPIALEATTPDEDSDFGETKSIDAAKVAANTAELIAVSMSQDIAANERVLTRLQDILNGNTPEQRRRRAERARERQQRADARSARRDALKQRSMERRIERVEKNASRTLGRIEKEASQNDSGAAF